MTADPWARLDDLLGVEPVAEVDEQVGDLAFFGRCSTEDNQDPETSRVWQLGNARNLVGPRGGHIVAEFFDIGHSPLGAVGAAAGVGPVVGRVEATEQGLAGAWSLGEGTRCWFGNQFSLIAPRFAAYGVNLWGAGVGRQVHGNQARQHAHDRFIG